VRREREKERGGFLKKPSNHSEEDIMGMVFRYTVRERGAEGASDPGLRDPLNQGGRRI